MHPLRIFVVEDSAVISDSLTQALEEIPAVIVVGTAVTEVDAVGWLTQNSDGYDLVIVDIFLRTGSALNVLRAGRALMGGAMLVVLTNYATPEMRRVCMELGAALIFDKSTQLEELVEYCRQAGHAMRPPTFN